MATLSIQNSVLTYRGLSSEVNDLTIYVTPEGCVFYDSGAVITSVPSGWNVSSDHHMANGDPSGFQSLNVDLSATSGSNVINVASTTGPATVSLGSGSNQVNVGGDAPRMGLGASIGGNLTVNSLSGGSGVLWVGVPFFSPSPGVILVESNKIQLSSGVVNYFGSFSEIRTIGSKPNSEADRSIVSYVISNPSAPYVLQGSGQQPSIWINETTQPVDIYFGIGVPGSILVRPMSALYGRLDITYYGGPQSLVLDATGQPGVVFTKNQSSSMVSITGASPSPVVYRPFGGSPVSLVTMGL